METLEVALAQLDPPLKHRVTFEEQVMHLQLIDPGAKAVVSRVLKPQEYQNPEVFYLKVLHAINEIRGLGSHAPLVFMRQNEDKTLDWEQR
ncbi:hypothetical protein [Pseudomonas sp. NPDC007930]|uniref:hypothetical protein n=1 Tax=Pseudomonas sp. NPDC007930 TaxID=3364417 RepID=UPI0036EF2EA9